MHGWPDLRVTLPRSLGPILAAAPEPLARDWLENLL